MYHILISTSHLSRRLLFHRLIYVGFTQNSFIWDVKKSSFNIPETVQLEVSLHTKEQGIQKLRLPLDLHLTKHIRHTRLLYTIYQTQTSIRSAAFSPSLPNFLIYLCRRHAKLTLL